MLTSSITGFPVRAVGLLWHSCDNWNFNASNPCLYAGGNYSQNGNHGLFYVNYTNATNANANHGCRILGMVMLTDFAIYDLCIDGTGFRAPHGEDKQ